MKPAAGDRRRARVKRIAFTAAAATALLAAYPTICRAHTPMAYTYGYGTKQYPVVSLLWGEIILSLFVIGVIALLVLVGSLVRHQPTPSGDIRDVPVTRGGNGLLLIYIGTGLSAAALFGFAVWTFSTLGAIAAPIGGKPSLTIHIIGHQWWWAVKYDNKNPARIFTTANEIHIPTGKPVRVQLTTADVIHSFWVPHLTGKMDLIPGQRNATWLEADRPGIYRGQCNTYCGVQHAHMAMLVIAQRPEQFAAWWANQLKPAPQPQTPLEREGETQFVAHCGACHTVRGTAANGKVGPDLSHLMTRHTIAAGTLPNTIGYLSGWIADPQDIKPGNLMPKLYLSGPQLNAIRAYLQTLK